MCHCLRVSLLASVCARVSGPQVFDGSCDACQGDDSQLTPIPRWVEGEKEGDEGMVEGSRFVLNEGKAGRQTAENAEGMEAGC